MEAERNLKEYLEGVHNRAAEQIKVNFENQKSLEERVENELRKNSMLQQEIAQLSATHELARVKRQEQLARAREALALKKQQVAANFGDLDSRKRELEQVNLYNREIQS
jgi:hypothetical protein